MNDNGEILCPGCDDYWPETPEFFFRDAKRKSGLMLHCKACVYQYPSMVKKHQSTKKYQKGLTHENTSVNL